MMRRKSNSKIRVGFLGKRTTYQAKESFKRVPETTEEKKAQLEQLLKPWSLKRPGSSYVYGSNVADSAPAPSPTPFPTPTPSPIVYTVSIQPSSATQYENVILSASTNLSSPTFVWTLVDFYDTTDTQVTSYTGATLTEGYFTSTGSGNVSVVATGDEGSATGSTFSVSEYVLSAETNVYLWYDFADESTWSTRVDAGTTYLTSLADKSGNGVDMEQSTASKQPILSGSATNGSLSAATFDGSADYLLSDRGSVTTPTGTTHIWMGRVYDGGASNNDTLYWHMDGLSYNADSIRYLNYNQGSSNQLLYNKAFYYQYKRNNWTDRPLTYAVRIEGDDATPPTRDVVMVNGITAGWTATAQANTGDYQYVALGAAIHNRDSANTQQMKGEIGEYIFFEEAIDDDTFTIIDRYLQYKWLGSMTY